LKKKHLDEVIPKLGGILAVSPSALERSDKKNIV